MIVIDEAEKITQTEATRYVRNLMLSSYIDDPIKSTIKQQSPKGKTVELTGISFLVDSILLEKLVDTLTRKFSYRQCLAFISDNQPRDNKKTTISIIQSADKYNTLRLQQTSGGSYLFSTDSLVEKLKNFEKKYPFHFIGAGDDWILIKTNDTPKDWTDFATEVLKVCPSEDKVNIDKFVEEIKSANGRVFMWWD